MFKRVIQKNKRSVVLKPQSPVVKEGWLKNWENFDGYADYPGVGKVYDKDVADFVVKHLRFIDFFNPKKIAVASIYAQLMLFGVQEMPKDPNFKW